MTGQQLKNSILQLAIQGKLVPQDPDDEPASVLLSRIRKEKEQLVKDGKLKKKDLVTTPISDEEKPFKIPEGWEWCRIASLGITNTGTTPSKSNPEFFGDFIPFLGPGDIQNGHISYEHNGLSQKGYSVARPVPANTILQVCIGGSIGKCAVVNRESTFNQQINSITTLHISHKYLYNCMLSDFFVKNMIDNSTGTATPIINKGSWDLLLIPLPPLAEQHRIVAKIEELMPLVDEYDKAQKKLDDLNAKLPEALKKSILQEAIMGKLGTNDPNDEPASELLRRIRKEKEQLVKDKKIKKEKPLPEITDEEKPFEIPENWEWCRLGEIFLHSSGKQLKASDTEGKLLPYITTSNLYWDYFVLDNLKSMYYKEGEVERCSAIEGDLLVCEGGDIGRSAIWPYKYSICLQNHIHRLRPIIGCAKYIYYIMMFYKFANVVGGKGIGIQGLSATALKSILIPLPPLAEQHRIVEKLETILPKLKKI